MARYVYCTTCSPILLISHSTSIAHLTNKSTFFDQFSVHQLSVSLFTNVEWSKVGCVLLYCEEFYADLGHAAITERLNVPSSAISAPSPSPSASSASASPPMETVSSLPNCMELISGYFNLHWALNNDSTVTLGLEGRPGNGNFWLGFGFSGPQAIAPVMVGSNVVIGGFINGQCFAYNYELSAKSQCDFSTGEGVCPDFAGKQPLVPSTSAKLISCEQVRFLFFTGRLHLPHSQNLSNQALNTTPQ